MALSKTCPKCGKIIEYKKQYCDECEVIVDKQRKARRNIYDRSDKGKNISKVYKTKQWKYTREAIKVRQNGLCLCCLKLKKTTPIDHIHHIVQAEDDKTLWYEPSNLVGLCESCHVLVHSHYKSSELDKVKMQEYLNKLIKEYE